MGKALSLGGLDLGNLMTRNRALLIKWIWQFPPESNSMWYRIIVSKYGHHPFEWLSGGVKGSLGTPVKK